MRRILSILFGAALLASSGCSSVVMLANDPEPYGGTRADLRILEDPTDTPVLSAYAVVDAPLSFAVDTVALPVVLATGHTEMNDRGTGRAFD